VLFGGFPCRFVSQLHLLQKVVPLALKALGHAARSLTFLHLKKNGSGNNSENTEHTMLRQATYLMITSKEEQLNKLKASGFFCT
jgi:hypothetical protein